MAAEHAEIAEGDHWNAWANQAVVPAPAEGPAPPVAVIHPIQTSLNDKIVKMQAEKKALKKAVQQSNKELKNEVRKKHRLLRRVEQLTEDDLLQAHRLKSQRREANNARAAQAAAQANNARAARAAQRAAPPEADQDGERRPPRDDEEAAQAEGGQQDQDADL